MLSDRQVVAVTQSKTQRSNSVISAQVYQEKVKKSRTKH